MKIKLLIVSILFATTTLAMSVQEKKKLFLDKVLPSIEVVYSDLQKQYENIKQDIKNNTNKEKILSLKKKYKVDSDDKLLLALKPHPKSIALAQAAIESAWGTSRFYREANNIFGIWAFGKNTPRIAALQKRDDKTIWIKKYKSIEDSVRDYYLNISRSFAFAKFRELNMKTSNPFSLVKELKMYSEKREVYSAELASILRYNKFYKYDQ